MQDPVTAAAEVAHGWAEYGPIGIVCFLMLICTYFIAKWARDQNAKMIERMEKAEERCNKEREAATTRMQAMADGALREATTAISANTEVIARCTEALDAIRRGTDRYPTVNSYHKTPLPR